MEPTQVKQLFIDLFGEKIEIYGLFVELIGVESRDWGGGTKIYDFDFEITNPNDVSYYTVPIEWEIQELIDEFTNYVDVRVSTTFFSQMGKRDLYFNKEKTEEIKNAFKKVDTIKFTTGTYLRGPSRYEVKIKSVGYKKGYEHEQIWLDNVIKPISATKNGEPCDVDDAILQYYEEFLPQNETYWESEHLYQHLDQVLSSIPSIGNNDILLEYSTELFHK
jgi:hypothetical protein